MQPIILSSYFYFIFYFVTNLSGEGGKALKCGFRITIHHYLLQVECTCVFLLSQYEKDLLGTLYHSVEL